MIIIIKMIIIMIIIIITIYHESSLPEGTHEYTMNLNPSSSCCRRSRSSSSIALLCAVASAVNGENRREKPEFHRGNVRKTWKNTWNDIWRKHGKKVKTDYRFHYRKGVEFTGKTWNLTITTLDPSVRMCDLPIKVHYTGE